MTAIEFLPRVLPASWSIYQNWGPDGIIYLCSNGLRVIASGSDFDGRDWLHVSFSRKDRIPSYEDTKLVKEIFIGNTKYAYQVFPPVDKHINIHSNTLHLWVPIDENNPFPDFTMGGNTI